MGMSRRLDCCLDISVLIRETETVLMNQKIV